MEKTRVAILYGGKSPEHNVSILSAMQIIETLDREKYVPVPVFIDRDGKFKIELLSKVDVAFPVLHGPYGEDGTMQGFLEILGIPYVGCGVAASAIAMDKELTKKILKSDGIPTARYQMAKEEMTFADIEELGLPFFVKPVHLGTSIGITKVESEEQFLPALQKGFCHDTRVIIEEYIEGREIECAVLGDKVSLPGEIILPRGAYYDFTLKTSKSDQVGYGTPADLPEAMQKEIQELSLKTFRAIGGEGLARIDFFLRGDKLFVNEINPIPGFTKTSLYPQMWLSSGVSFKSLLTDLIQDANCKQFTVK
ncbi:MAG: D-alanine--D-alanine ligase family protein [Chlamydiales bacterium]